MLERFQQLLAAALGGAAAIGADGHQHDRFSRKHPADAVLDQGGRCAVALAAVLRQPLQLPLGHPWIVLQLEGVQVVAIAAVGAHPADEQALGAGGLAVVLQVALPALQQLQGIKRLRVQIDLQLHGESLNPR